MRYSYEFPSRCFDRVDRVAGLFLSPRKKALMPTNELDKAARSELHYAARDGNVEEVRRFIRGGTNIDLSDKNGDTPLHFAAQEQKAESCEDPIGSRRQD